MPAEVEEVVVGPHPLESENLRECLAHDLFPDRCRPAAPGASAVIGSWKCALVDLPVGRQRQRVQHHHRRGHHVFRKPVRREAAQGRRQVLDSGVIFIAGSDHVADEAHVTGHLFPEDRYRLGDRRVSG